MTTNGNEEREAKAVHTHDWQPEWYDEITEVEIMACPCGAKGYRRSTHGPVTEGEPPAA